MASSGVQALLVSSQASDTQLIEQLLKQSSRGLIKLSTSHTAREAKFELQQQHFDVLLMGTECEIEERLSLIRWTHDGEHFDPPVITLNHQHDKPNPKMGLQPGVADSLSMEQLTAPLLERAIRYAIHQRADEIRLLKLAQSDPLTGVGNRLLFEQRLREQIAFAKRSKQLMALMILDLDRFKSVNDLLGHVAGDQLLIDVAARVKNCIRETDTLARLGGDEFAIIATQLNQLDDASIMAQAIIDACKFPVESEFEKLMISCSIGISLYPRDGDNPKDLLHHADLALLQSKAQGSSCFHFSDASTNLINEDRQLLCDTIDEALSRDHFSLHYQPIISCKDGSIVAAEALLRWQHPSLGDIPPEQFLPIIEARGLGTLVSQWILKAIQRQHKDWLDYGIYNLAISIKLSPFQLEYNTLVNILGELGENNSFPVQLLQFEIDESAIFTCSKESFDALFELHELGIKIVVSNFGKGFCSLTQLHQLPVSSIKIDRSLIQQLDTDSSARAITEAIIQLGKVMNIEVIAHGVENIDIVQYLAEKHCDHFQGYAISQPIGGTDFGRWHFQHLNKIQRMGAH